MEPIEPIEHIRKVVFQAKQTEFAVIAGTTQATVCRWELKVDHVHRLHPNRENMERIRAEAVRLGKAWDDRWFFEVPAPVAEAAE